MKIKEIILINKNKVQLIIFPGIGFGISYSNYPRRKTINIVLLCFQLTIEWL